MSTDTPAVDGLRSRPNAHWRFADRLARAFPRASVDPAVLYVDSGQVLTSAGVAAGLDLCLHMIRADHGAAEAAHAVVARHAALVLPRSRPPEL